MEARTLRAMRAADRAVPKARQRTPQFILRRVRQLNEEDGLEWRAEYKAKARGQGTSWGRGRGWPARC